MFSWKSLIKNLIPLTYGRFQKSLELSESKAEERYRRMMLKLTMKDDIYFLRSDIKIYVPYYPIDFIQRHIVDNNEFYEIYDLHYIDQFLNSESTVIDVGANIGNHTLYWGLVTKVGKVFSFEPVEETYNILCRNIELNHLQNKVIAVNTALGDKKGIGHVIFSRKETFLGNAGGTSIEENDPRETYNIKVPIMALDDFVKTTTAQNSVDLLKIDVEGGEYKVLTGALTTIKTYKPVILIEIWDDFDKCQDLLNSLGYKLIKTISPNYCFVHTDSKWANLM